MAEIANQIKTFTAGEDLLAYCRVKLSSGSGTQVEYADAGDEFIGVTEAGAASGATVAVRLWPGNSTFKMRTSGAVTAGSPVYGTDDGEVDDAANGWVIGWALSNASADQGIIEVAPNVQSTSGVLTKTADYTLTAADSGKTVDSTGATGAVTITLPAAVPGLEYYFRVGAAQELRIDPNGTETISLPSTGVAGAAGKYLTADAAGETVHLKCIKAGTWSVFGYTGTWTAEA